MTDDYDPSNMMEGFVLAAIRSVSIASTGRSVRPGHERYAAVARVACAGADRRRYDCHPAVAQPRHLTHSISAHQFSLARCSFFLRFSPRLANAEKQKERRSREHQNRLKKYTHDLSIAYEVFSQSAKILLRAFNWSMGFLPGHYLNTVVAPHKSTDHNLRRQGEPPRH